MERRRAHFKSKSLSREAMIEDPDAEGKLGCIGTRHIIAIMTFLGQTVSYLMRVNLSVGIVAMVNSTANHNAQAQEIVSGSTCPIDNSTIKENSLSDGEFLWNEEEQGIILGAFFWGYIVTQIPGGILANRYGGKWFLGVGLLITAVLCFVTPPVVKVGGKSAFIALRVVQGLGEGVVQPATHALMSRWLPPLERSKLGGWVYAGNPLGTVIAMLTSGLLIQSGFLGGWPSVFYVFGFVGIVWFVFWCFLVYDSPATHPRISREERHLIETAIGQKEEKEDLPIPWKDMLSSWQLWAILIAQTGNGWGLYTLLTELPNYMKNILNFDIAQNSALSSLPYIVMFIVSQVSTLAADWFRSKKYLSTTKTRKIFNTIAHWTPAVALIAAGYTDCDRVSTVALLTIAVGSSGAVYASAQVSHLDIAPNFAGVMMGITNGLSNITGIAAPLVVGLLTKHNNTLEQWRIVFYIAAVIYFLDNLFYILVISGEEQPWNWPEGSQKPIEGISTGSNVKIFKPGD